MGALVQYFQVYIKKGDEIGSKGNAVREPGTFPVLPLGEGEGEGVGSDMVIVAACFHIQYFAEFLHGKWGVGDDFQFHGFTVVFFLEILFGILRAYGSVMEGIVPADSAVRQDIHSVRLPMAEKVGIVGCLPVRSFAFYFENKDNVFLQNIGCNRGIRVFVQDIDGS